MTGTLLAIPLSLAQICELTEQYSKCVFETREERTVLTY